MRWAPLALLVACAGGEADDTDTTAELQWFLTCGDPVCQGYTGPFDGVPLCETEVEGDACAEDGATCDPQNDCNALLVCASEDPTQQAGGCPISQRAAKTDIRYLDADEVDRLARSVEQMPLATWRYTWRDEGTQLGFVIEDVPGSPAVRADGGHVDLYGYTSLAVAALQAQSREIDALRAEIEALRSELRDGVCEPGAGPRPEPAR